MTAAACEPVSRSTIVTSSIEIVGGAAESMARDSSCSELSARPARAALADNRRENLRRACRVQRPNQSLVNASRPFMAKPSSTVPIPREANQYARPDGPGQPHPTPEPAPRPAPLPARPSRSRVASGSGGETARPVHAQFMRHSSGFHGSGPPPDRRADRS